MSDIADFLKSYNATLQQEIAADMLAELTEKFTFYSLEKRQPEREVYFVTRKSDGKRVVLRVTGTDDAENVAAESAILNRLDHPSIPKVLGAWEHNGRSFLVREYFSGDDMYAYIRKHGPLNKERLTSITLRLCDILSYLHAQNPPVIHRDIKPENIILSGGDEVKLIDFGIARNFRQNEESTENDKDTRVAGTKPYMAPEQFGSEQTDNRTDLYSLGVLMIYMVTGKTDRKNLKKDADADSTEQVESQDSAANSKATEPDQSAQVQSGEPRHSGTSSAENIESISVSFILSEDKTNIPILLFR